MIRLAIPIERGNSGGPLLDRQARVLGLLTMKSAVTDNIGFAMNAPDNMYLPDVQSAADARNIAQRFSELRGSFDWIAEVDGVMTLGDWKSSKGVYPKSALQCAAYARAELSKDSMLSLETDLELKRLEAGQ